MKKALWTIIIILAIAAIAFIAIKKQNPTAFASPVKIAGVFMLSGPSASEGEAQTKGVNLAIETINAEGGINGHPLDVVVEDVAYDQKTAVSVYQALKSKELRLFIIDGNPIVEAVRDLVAKDGNFMIAAEATAPLYADGSNLTCRIALAPKSSGLGMISLLERHNYKKVGLLLPDNEYGKSLAQEFTNAFLARGGSVVISEFYSTAPGATDFRTNLSKIKYNKAFIDAVIFSNTLTSIEPMLAQMKELQIESPIISDNPTLENPLFKDQSLLEGTEFVDYDYVRAIQPTDSPKTKAFKEAYKKKYAADPQYLAAGSYDVTMLIAQAIKAVGAEPQKVADYISHLQNYPAVTGAVSFNSDCEVDRNLVFRTIKDGKVADLK
jgi:branched-chain amino acid transport system substrate-binding protein